MYIVVIIYCLENNDKKTVCICSADKIFPNIFHLNLVDSEETELVDIDDRLFWRGVYRGLKSRPCTYRQAVYHLSHTPAHYALGYFFQIGSHVFAWGQLQFMVLLTMTEITGHTTTAQHIS
jgi:hypothetical protein